MRVNDVTFFRCQLGWWCTIGFRLTTARQFTEEFRQVGAGSSWWIVAYFRAWAEMKKEAALRGAKPGEREAKGWQ